MTEHETDTTDPEATDRTERQTPNRPDRPAETDRRLLPDGDVAEPGHPDGPEAEADGSFLGPDIERKFKAGAAVVLGLLATWATIQIYIYASRSIEIWISSDFVPVFRLAFNVVVVLVCLAGIVWIVRELA